MALTHLTLADYSDRELLHIVDECANDAASGYATSLEVAVALGIEAEYPARSTGSRLGNLRKWGLLRTDPDYVERRWALSTLGEAVAFGKPKQQTLNSISSTGAADVILMARVLGQRRHAVGDGLSRVMQREFRRQWMVNGG